MPRHIPLPSPEKPGMPWHQVAMVKQLAEILKDVTQESVPQQDEPPASPADQVVEDFKFLYVSEPLQDQYMKLYEKNMDIVDRMMREELPKRQLQEEMAQHVRDLQTDHIPEVDAVHSKHFAEAYKKYEGQVKIHKHGRAFFDNNIRINEGADGLPLEYRIATEEQWEELMKKMEPFRYVREGSAMKFNIYLGHICTFYKAGERVRDICPCLEQTVLQCKASVIHMAVANHQYQFLQELSGYAMRNPHLQDLVGAWVRGEKDMAYLVDLALFREYFDGEGNGRADTIQTLIDPTFCYFRANIGLFRGHLPKIAGKGVYSDYLHNHYKDNLLSLLIATHQWNLVSTLVQGDADHITDLMIPQLMVELAYCGDVVRARKFLLETFLDWVKKFFAKHPETSTAKLLFTGGVMRYETCLHAAVRAENMEMLDLLLSFCHHVNAVVQNDQSFPAILGRLINVENLTPLDLTIQLEMKDMEEKIRSYQERPISRDESKRMFIEMMEKGTAKALVDGVCPDGASSSSVTKSRHDKNLELLPTMVVLEDHESTYRVLHYYFREGMIPAKRKEIDTALRYALHPRSSYQYVFADEAEQEKNTIKMGNMVCVLLAAGARVPRDLARWESKFLVLRVPQEIRQLFRDAIRESQLNPQEPYLLRRLETAFDDYRENLQL